MPLSKKQKLGLLALFVIAALGVILFTNAGSSAPTPQPHIQIPEPGIPGEEIKNPVVPANEYPVPKVIVPPAPVIKKQGSLPIVQFSGGAPGMMYVYPGNPNGGQINVGQAQAILEGLTVGSSMFISSHDYPDIDQQRVKIISADPSSTAFSVQLPPGKVALDTTCCSQIGTMTVA